MKKCLAILFALVLLLQLPGCSCKHDYHFRAEDKKTVCRLCGDDKGELIPEITSIKILAIGNSFSVDAMEYLWSILTDAGFKDVLLGNLYIGGCSLDTHWSNIQSDATSYIYYYNNNGVWLEKTSSSVISTLKSEDWDIITVQQASPDSGKPETYTNLQNILTQVQKNKTNPNAKIYWHMTWAYQSDSNHDGFPAYDKDQMKMYNAIAGAAQSEVVGLKDIAGVIPSGTAIQNLRGVYGDELTRDGYHLNYGIGRYTAAMTWFAYLTGMNVEDIKFTPSSGEMGIKMYRNEINQAVKDALQTPFEVTEIE